MDFATEVLQDNHYYPFGLNTEGPWMNDAALDNKYQYNGKELSNDFGLNLNDYEARWYDASLGRWWSADGLSSKFPHYTSYQYAGNKPINSVDLDGLEDYLIINRFDANSIKQKISIISSTSNGSNRNLALFNANSGERLVRGTEKYYVVNLDYEGKISSQFATNMGGEYSKLISQGKEAIVTSGAFKVDGLDGIESKKFNDG